MTMTNDEEEFQRNSKEHFGFRTVATVEVSSKKNQGGEEIVIGVPRGSKFEDLDLSYMRSHIDLGFMIIFAFEDMETAGKFKLWFAKLGSHDVTPTHQAPGTVQ